MNRKLAMAVALVGALLLAMFVPPPAPAAAASGATFTSFFPEEAANCKQKQDVNCNHYTGKQYVVINGGPSGANLGDGTYFFAVLAPGGQKDPNGTYDAATNPKVLSTDDVSERTFTVTGGVLEYTGSHEHADVIVTSGGKGKKAVTTSTSDHRIRMGEASVGWFQDTPNPGGVYIAAICKVDNPGDPGRPRICKYDAFKVNEPDDVLQVKGNLSGMKYTDLNQDGLLDLNEPGIAGWWINIYEQADFDADPATATPVASVQTSAVAGQEGLWTWETPSFPEGTGGEDAYIVCESQSAGWTQTGPSAIGPGTEPIGGVSTVDLYGATMCYRVTVERGSAGSGGIGLNFGNVPDVTLSGAKYFDGGATVGRRDGTAPAWTEAGIEGWPIIIEVSDGAGGWLPYATEATDVDGNFSSVVEPGNTYRVSEAAAPGGSGWTQTGNTFDQSVVTPSSGGPAVSLNAMVYEVTVPVVEFEGVDPAPTLPSAGQLFFGNVCFEESTPGGRTLGFWHNKNGQALITSGNITALAGKNLKYNNGSDYDPPNKAHLSNWLVNANSNGSGLYMLSAQWTATFLNTKHGFTDPTASITWTVNGTAMTKTVAGWLSYANTYLGSGSYNKTKTTQLKNLFDAINNNQTFTSGECATPTWDN